MTEKPCYKEDSLEDFATWAKNRGHYTVASLIQNYLEYKKNVEPFHQQKPHD